MPINDQKSFLKTNTTLQIAIFFFIISRVIALFFSFRTFTDVVMYYDYYRKFSYGLIPYFHFDFEYQPLSFLLIITSGIFANHHDITSYYFSYVALMLLFDVLNIYLCIKICKKYAMSQQSINFMIIIYSLLGLVFFKILYHRLDIVVASFILLSIYLLLKGRDKSLFINSYAGFFYKIIPTFNLPAAIIVLNSPGNNFYYRVFQQSFYFLLIVILTMLGLELVANEYIYSILHHANRGIQMESLYGSIILFTDLITGHISHIDDIYGAFHVRSTLFFEYIAKYLGFFILALFHLYLARLGAQKKLQRSDFLTISLLVFLLFISFQRVLSPQFLIWILPLLAIYLSINRLHKDLMIWCLIYLLSALIFYPHYGSLINQEPILINLLLIRNLLLIYMSFKIFSNFSQQINER